jgi:hypothetical protein
MSTMKHAMPLARVVCTWLTFLVGSAFAAPLPVTAPDAGSGIAMEWTDLRVSGAPGVAVFKQVWNDRLVSAQRKWAASNARSPTLPAFTLAHMFTGPLQPTLVSILFDAFDCELPGNGPGANLYARCPMRVATGVVGASHVKTVDGVCYLYVPPIARSGDGPDPAKNYTTAWLDSSAQLHLRVVQFGRHVQACDLDVQVG